MRAALLLALLAAPTVAQQVLSPATPAHGVVAAGKAGLQLPAGEFTVQELIDATAAYLCRNYVYDAWAVQRAPSFTLQRPLALDALGAEELLYALLSTRDFAVLPIDEPRGIYQIALLDPNQPRAAVLVSTPWRSQEDVLLRPQLREIVFTAIELQHTDAQLLATLLRNGFQTGTWRPGVLLPTAVERRTLLLHGYRDQVAQAIVLAQRFDQLHRSPLSSEHLAASLQQRLLRLEQEVAELRRELAARR